MTISSINTNLAAELAQINISNATSATSDDVSALSSGNRIVNASTDVAALAAGTGLQSQVNVLTSSLSVAAQGSSLLQVADGGLAQIQAILQRQQAITTSAESGSLSTTQLGFLNQEFQALTTEINNIANQTNFNGVSLLNGAIASGTSINTNTTNGSTSAPISATIGLIESGNVAADDTFTLKVPGQTTQTFTFGTGTGDVGVGATAADSAANLAAAINNSALSQLADFRVVAGGSLGTTLTAYYTGAATSLANIPAITSGTNATGDIGSTGTASFVNGSTLANIVGDINPSDQLLIGSHTITFVTGAPTATVINANGTTSGEVSIGAVPADATATGLANLVTYLNTNAGTTGFSDIAGITFSSDDTANLYGVYTGGGSVQPLLTTSYTSASSISFTGVTGGNVSPSSVIFTLPSTAFTNGDVDLVDDSSSLVIGAATIGFSTGGSSGLGTLTPTVDASGNLSQTLSNVASYLNGETASLGGNYANLTYASDGTNIYAVNSLTDAPVTGLSSDFTNSLPFGATADTVASTDTGATSDLITLNSLFNLNPGNTIVSNGVTITLVSTNATVGTDELAVGTNASDTLAALATYFGLHATALGDSGFTFTSDSTDLQAINSGNGSAETPAQITLAGGVTPTDVTDGSNVTVQAPSLVGQFTGSSPIVAGDTLVVNGQTYTFITGASTGNSVHVAANTSLTIAQLVTQLNANATDIADDLVFSQQGTNLYAQNSVGVGTSTVSTGPFTGLGAVTFTGITNLPVDADSVVGLGAGVTSAIGSPSGSLLVTDDANPASATNYGNGIDLSDVANNAAFLGAFGGTGTIGAITGTYVDTNNTSTSGVQFSVTVGQDTYTTATITNAKLSSATATTPVTITFNGSNNTTSAPEGGSFTITLQPQSNIDSQIGASQLATGINAALSTVSAYQNRNVLSYNNNYSATVGGDTIATLAGSSLAFNSDDFTSPVVSAVSVTAPSTGSTDATITATINGQTYSTISGIGDTFGANNEIVLVNESNPDQTLTLTLGSSGSANLSSASNAAAFQTALSDALGLSSGGAGGLNFQVGTTSTDTLGVSLASSTASALGLSSQDVLTTADAATAATAVQNALNTVTGLRATVGADEETFNFATSALTAASQNEGAAESNLLDTDVAATSTTFATNQVQLQAGIAVLAQANQLPQNLLKLLA